MPNNGRITLCPYYRDEKNLSISCEDTYRRFRWPAQKIRWLDTYCDKNWQECPYARELNAVYERTGGEMNEKDRIEHELRAKDKELRKVSAMMGKMEKREKEKDEKIRRLQRERGALEKLYIKARKQSAELEEKLEKVRKELEDLSLIYETRFAYLMDKAGGRLDEGELREWLAKYEFAIQACEVAKNEVTGRNVVATWELVKKEISKEEEHGEV